MTPPLPPSEQDVLARERRAREDAERQLGQVRSVAERALADARRAADLAVRAEHARREAVEALPSDEERREQRERATRAADEARRAIDAAREAREALAEREAEVARLQAERDEAAAARADAERTAEEALGRVDEALARAEAAEAARASLEHRVGELGAQLEAAAGRNAQLETLLARERAERQGALNPATVATELGALRDELADARREAEEAAAGRAAEAAAHAEQRDRAQRLEDELGALHSRIAQERAALEQRLEDAETAAAVKAGALRDRVAALERELDAARGADDEADELQRALDEARGDAERLAAEVARLTESLDGALAHTSKLAEQRAQDELEREQLAGALASARAALEEARAVAEEPAVAEPADEPASTAPPTTSELRALEPADAGHHGAIAHLHRERLLALALFLAALATGLVLLTGTLTDVLR